MTVSRPETGELRCNFGLVLEQVSSESSRGLRRLANTRVGANMAVPERRRPANAGDVAPVVDDYAVELQQAFETFLRTYVFE